jgi:hypothetical protein
MAFDLTSITRSRAMKAPRLVVYGTDGVGKSTFAAGAPNPVFVFTEDSVGTLDVAHFPIARTKQDVVDAIASLCEGEHDFSTVVLDTADWLEALIDQDIQSRHDAKELAYGKGAVKLAEEWRSLLTGFDYLRNERGMAVIILAHCEIKRFDSPETDPYDRYQLKLASRSGDVLREWADAVLFANYRTVVTRTEVGFNKQVSRGISSGERMLYTSDRPAYRAKNRYGLPDQIPLSWDALSAAISAGDPRNQPVEQAA